MKVNVGDVVQLVPAMKTTPLLGDHGEISRKQLGFVTQQDLMIVLRTFGSSGLEINVLTSTGMIGWVMGAWVTPVIKRN